MANFKTAYVLVGHGAPPSDFPQADLAEYFRLHMQAEAGALPEKMRVRYEELDERMKRWPRTPENDPYKNGLERLARAIEKEAGVPVFLAFNEFCAPTILEAVDQAVQHESQKIVVAPTMLIRGGSHSEHDIPEALRQISANHSSVEIAYAWPFAEEQLVQLFVDQLGSFAGREQP